MRKVKVLGSRARKCRKIRREIAEKDTRVRLTVHRSGQHIYAQVFSSDGSQVIAAASSLEKDVRKQDFGPGKIKLSESIGKLVGERAISKGIKQVAFDRSGFKYHGCIKALADGARASGLEF